MVLGSAATMMLKTKMDVRRMVGLADDSLGIHVDSKPRQLAVTGLMRRFAG